MPVVSAISPASGPTAGGTVVTVSGSGLTGATTVYFGSSKGTTVSANAGGTQLTVKSPAGTSGTSVAVRVVTPGGESASVTADLFTYGPIVTSISPASGSTAGGSQVTVTGIGFSTVTGREVRDNGRHGTHGQVVHPAGGHVSGARSRHSEDLGDHGRRDDAGHPG